MSSVVESLIELEYVLNLAKNTQVDKLMYYVEEKWPQIKWNKCENWIHIFIKDDAIKYGPSFTQ